ncbi:Sorting nexin, cytoplasm-to-vacuole targeting pathway/endosomal sorting, partial [Quaeritorhiza haematococci]
MSGSTFITYVIRTTIPSWSITYEAKHRYSEFETLRKLLTKVYTSIVVPPIPEKHSMTAYATKQGKAKEDPHIIEKRKHMLQSFLNRVASHPVLGREHVVHRFLEGEASWNEIFASSGLAMHLKKKDKGPLGKLTERGTLKNPDPHFIAAEDFTAKFISHMSYTLKVQKRIAKHYQDIISTYTDLGATYNGWSLTETALSRAIERVGEAVDDTVGATTSLSQGLEHQFGQPLEEYVQFGKIVEKLLRWRHRKHVDYETVTDTLQAKQASLQKLESSEEEAQRIAAVLNGTRT